jgi:hypothetical protein
VNRRRWLLLLSLVLVLAVVTVRAETLAVFVSVFSDDSCRTQMFRAESTGFVCKYPISDIYCPNGSGPCEARDTPDTSPLPFCSAYDRDLALRQRYQQP